MGGRYGGDIAGKRKPRRMNWNRTLEGLLPDLLPHLRRPSKTNPKTKANPSTAKQGATT